MRSLLPAALAAAPLLLGACSYDYSNPAETLGTGEVTGRVVADAGSGPAGLADVSVWLKNSSAVQTTPATGRPLPSLCQKTSLSSVIAMPVPTILCTLHSSSG